MAIKPFKVDFWFYKQAAMTLSEIWTIRLFSLSPLVGQGFLLENFGKVRVNR